MAAINLRVPSGLIPLTNQQVDDNFQNLNNALGAAGSTTIPTPSGSGVPLLSVSPTTSGTFTAANITYTGGLIGSTAVINIGTNQIYKDASGNVGLGNVPSGTYKLQVTGGISSTTSFTSSVATGTAPLFVTSTTNVANLNASSLNGATFAAPGIIGGTTPSAITGSNLMSNGGIWTKTTYTGTTYTSGVLIDYTTNLGRISVGASAGLAFYNGGLGATELVRIDASGRVGIGGVPAAVALEVISTGAILVAKGTTAQQPSGIAGYLRFNTTTSQFEGHNGTAWASVGGSAINNDIATTTNIYPLCATATSGTALNIYTSNTKYLYKPSTGELSSPEIIATNGFVLNSSAIASNYTVGAGMNAMSVGPITINSGVVITVASGQRWIVI